MEKIFLFEKKIEIVLDAKIKDEYANKSQNNKSLIEMTKILTLFI